MSCHRHVPPTPLPSTCPRCHPGRSRGCHVPAHAWRRPSAGRRRRKTSPSCCLGEADTRCPLIRGGRLQWLTRRVLAPVRADGTVRPVLPLLMPTFCSANAAIGYFRLSKGWTQNGVSRGHTGLSAFVLNFVAPRKCLIMISSLGSMRYH